MKMLWWATKNWCERDMRNSRQIQITFQSNFKNTDWPRQIKTIPDFFGNPDNSRPCGNPVFGSPISLRRFWAIFAYFEPKYLLTESRYWPAVFYIYSLSILSCFWPSFIEFFLPVAQKMPKTHSKCALKLARNLMRRNLWTPLWPFLATFLTLTFSFWSIWTLYPKYGLKYGIGLVRSNASLRLASCALGATIRRDLVMRLWDTAPDVTPSLACILPCIIRLPYPWP